MATYYFVMRVFFKKSTGKQENSIQKFDDETQAYKRFYNVLAADIDSGDLDFELVQIVRQDGVLLATQTFDNRSVEEGAE